MDPSNADQTVPNVGQAPDDGAVEISIDHGVQGQPVQQSTPSANPAPQSPQQEITISHAQRQPLQSQTEVSPQVNAPAPAATPRPVAPPVNSVPQVPTSPSEPQKPLSPPSPPRAVPIAGQPIKQPQRPAQPPQPKLTPPPPPDQVAPKPPEGALPSNPPTEEAFMSRPFGETPPVPAFVQENHPSIPQTTKQTRAKHGKRFLIIAAVFVAVLLAGGLLWLVVSSFFLGGQQGPRVYSNTGEYVHEEAQKGAGFSFDYPVEMQVRSTEESSVLIEDRVPENQQSKTGLVQYATIEVSTTKTGELTSNARSQVLDQVLERARDGELQGGAGGEQVSGLEVSDFTANEKETEYVADISYLVNAQNGAAENARQFNGKLKVSFGKNYVYFLLVQSEQSTWEQNQEIWEGVLGSFRYDL